jgi:hypothetical protein
MTFIKSLGYFVLKVLLEWLVDKLNIIVMTKDRSSSIKAAMR